MTRSSLTPIEPAGDPADGRAALGHLPGQHDEVVGDPVVLGQLGRHAGLRQPCDPRPAFVAQRVVLGRDDERPREAPDVRGTERRRVAVAGRRMIGEVVAPEPDHVLTGEEIAAAVLAHRHGVEARLERGVDEDERLRLRATTVAREEAERGGEVAAGADHRERRAELEDFIRRRPKVREYAAFRARMDREGTTWPTWAPGSLNQDWTDPLFKRYILCQFWADGQITALGRNSRDWGLRGLYLDLPLGVHSDSYDTWQYKEHFARGVSAGAPPDAFFTLGQDWGFPPLHPSRIRDLGHEYFREVLDFHAAASAMLRVDHVMGLFRLYWIPWGMGPKAGAYVRYPAEELLALFCLASVRNHCSLVGEDLGTVPPAVRPAMCSRGIDRLYVAQFSIHPVNPVLDLPPDNAIACVNTHDLPPFAAFWLGTDIDDRQDLGLFDHEQAASEHADRRQLRGALLGELGLSAKDDGDGEDSTLAIDPTEVLGLLVERLRRSSCRGLLVNMEDLWAAVEPQNVPGTWKERPNWRRKAKISLDDLESSAGWKCLKKWFESAETIS